MNQQDVITNSDIPAWEDGVLRPVDKLEVHRRALRHKAISVFIMRGSDLLIQQRAACKYHSPGPWANTCCTHPHWEEKPMDAAKRRLMEELGISGVALSHRGILEYRADVGQGLFEHEVVDVYVGQAGTDFRYELNPTEVQAVQWIDVDRLRRLTESHPQRYSKWLQIYLREHASQIFAADPV